MTNYKDKKVKDFMEEDWQIPLPTSFTFDDIRQVAEDNEIDISELTVDDLDRIGEKFMEYICRVGQVIYGKWVDDMKEFIENYMEERR